MGNAEYFLLVDWTVLVSPLVKFEPSLSGRYVVNTANEWQALRWLAINGSGGGNRFLNIVFPSFLVENMEL